MTAKIYDVTVKYQDINNEFKEQVITCSCQTADLAKTRAVAIVRTRVKTFRCRPEVISYVER